VARRIPLKVWVGVAVSLAFTVFFVWTVEWASLGQALAEVRIGYVALASVLLLGEFALRAVRWKVLLRPIVPQARVQDLFVASVIGAAANTLLPLRAGEIAKALVAAKKTGAGIPQVISTAVMERVYDIFGLVCVLVTMVLVLPDDPTRGAEELELVDNLKLYGGLFGFVAMTCMAIFFVLASRGQQARGLFQRLSHLAPRPIAGKFDELFDGFVEGLGNAKDFSGIWQAGLLSLGVWFNGALAIYVLFAAFDLRLPFGAACFTAVAIALTVAIPQAPGFFGVFHVAMEKTMTLWAVPGGPAAAFAIVFWGVSFLPVTLVGLLALWREGLSLGSLWSRDGQPDGQPPAAPVPVADSVDGGDP
jgi:uncharacterized protein (TIRG00374 family)